jgi:hypothetical protein
MNFELDPEFNFVQRKDIARREHTVRKSLMILTWSPIVKERLAKLLKNLEAIVSVILCNNSNSVRYTQRSQIFGNRFGSLCFHLVQELLEIERLLNRFGTAQCSGIFPCFHFHRPIAYLLGGSW